MKIGNLTLARIWDDAEPEFKDCTRCGIQMSGRREFAECSDCLLVNRYQPLPRQLGNGGFLPIDPAYEVSLHYPKQAKECPTMATLDALHIPYFNYTATSDRRAFDYAKALITSKESEPVDYPIVVITSHGQVIDFWTGFNLAKLNAILAARKAATNRTQEPFLLRVPSRELVAA